MKRLIVAGALLATLVVCPAVALSKPATAQHVREYTKLYRRVAHEFGKRKPGRMIVRDGTAKGPATDAQVEKSIALFRLWLAPPPAPVVTPVVTNPITQVSRPITQPSSVSYSGGYSIPSSIVSCESGGNWGAVNASSGAGGAYQILPSTWAAYGGTGAPQDASPAEQSAIAARIYAADGPSAWSCG